MKVKVTADSTCDLPPQLCEEYGVELLPLHVVLGEQSYADRLEIDAEKLFEYMAGGEQRTCHTAACNLIQYQQVFSKYQDYDAIIHISISAELSCSYANAMQAAEDFPQVHIVDSRNICGGSGLLAERAALLVQAGLEPPQILEQLRDLSTRLDSSFIINSLDYLRRGGRCSALSRLGANLLQMKLCLELENGCIEAGKKYRGSFGKCLKKYIDDRFGDLQNIEDEALFFATTGLPPELVAEARAMIEDLQFFKRIVDVEAGCVIACHSGPGACGLFFARK